jgi:hypothetical protein
MVGHQTICRDYTDVDHCQQTHRVTCYIRVYLVVASSEGHRGQHDHRLAWRGLSVLGHVDKTVEVMAPLRPQL